MYIHLLFIIFNLIIYLSLYLFIVVCQRLPLMGKFSIAAIAVLLSVAVKEFLICRQHEYLLFRLTFSICTLLRHKKDTHCCW